LKKNDTFETNLSRMKQFILFTFLSFFTSLVFSQEDSTTISNETDALLEDDLFAGEETSTQTALLPIGMGPIKRAFWGENGLMRNFNTFELTPEKRERELIVRRRMLQTHQVMGMVTLGTMLASAVTGQIMISTKLGSTQEKIKPIHQAATTSTMIAYSTTALLQLLAPPPIIIRKNKGWSNIKAHRTLAYLHFTGMVMTPIIGQMMYGSLSLENGKSEQLRSFHQKAGYVTTGLFAAAVIVMKF
jgi:hypothetical protein